MSDHLPVVAKFGHNHDKQHKQLIPQHVIQDPLFSEVVDKNMDDFVFSRCCWARVSEVKDIYRHAYSVYQENQKNRGARFSKEKVFWSLQAIRASDCGDLELYTAAIRAAPQLQHDSFQGVLPISPGALAHTREIVREALQLDDDGMGEELQQIESPLEHEQTRRRETL